MSQTNYRNSILSVLSAADRSLLDPHLEAVSLPLRFQIELPNKPIPNVYFPEQGLASVLAGGSDGRQIEVGLIGREGVTGMAVILGAGQTPHNTFMQVAGSGLRISSTALVAAMEKSPSLQRALTRASQAFSVQAGYTALANGKAEIDERLARWLLMCQDRLQDDLLPLTHEFLSFMLGVRRAGVTVAIKQLAEKGLVEGRRSAVFVKNRKGLIKLAASLYGPSELEYERLTGCSLLPAKSPKERDLPSF
jgi:CRP-like cAMP-binding protein